MATKKATNGQGERAVVVTTKHRGVFFGYTEDVEGERITLKRARCCVRWRNIRGFVNLAGDGPNAECRVTPSAPKLVVRDITAVLEMTPKAIEAWEAGPWGK